MARRAQTPEQREAARLRAAKYNAKPESIEARKAYYRRPEVQARYKARAATRANREYMKQWRASERGKQVAKEAGLRQRAFTLELWETLKAFQGNACAVCRTPFSDDTRFIHADHCHEQNLPRGLLCQPCNIAEGLIQKTGLSPEEFGRRLTAYLGDPPAARAVTVDRENSRKEKPIAAR
jgi:hypothetical protein